jgi:hypothetical protein
MQFISISIFLIFVKVILSFEIYLKDIALAQLKSIFMSRNRIKIFQKLVNNY